MKSIAVCTLGCKVNQYESEAVIQMFEKEGYETVPFDSYADVYIINTCTVTNIGDRKSRQMIRRAKNKNPDAIVVVTGCYAQSAPDEVESIEGVNLIIGTKGRTNIVEMVKKIEAGMGTAQPTENNNMLINAVGDIMSQRTFENLNVGSYTRHNEKVRAFLKIQDGCDQYCSYCIIPFVRGHVRSRKPENITEEIELLAENGYKEVVFSGIHLASYGKDLSGSSLADLLKQVQEIEGIQRIRLGSIEPGLIDKSFLEDIKGVTKLCRHFHISLQSGSKGVLERMNRRYSPDEYYEVVKMLRDYYDDPAITTDIMVGFPQESEEEFEESYDFVKKIGFSEIHVFQYSQRRMTKAADMPGQVHPEIKEIRSKKMTDLGQKLHKEFLEKRLNNSLEVLFERNTENNIYEGHSDDYITVMTESNIDLIGKILKVHGYEIEGNAILAKP